MPTFEYLCRDCDQEIEVFLRGNEKAVCPNCQSHKLEKLISAPAGHASTSSLPMLGAGCPPSDAPPCNPNCCRLP